MMLTSSCVFNRAKRLKTLLYLPAAIHAMPDMEALSTRYLSTSWLFLETQQENCTPLYIQPAKIKSTFSRTVQSLDLYTDSVATPTRWVQRNCVSEVGAIRCRGLSFSAATMRNRARLAWPCWLSVHGCKKPVEVKCNPP